MCVCLCVCSQKRSKSSAKSSPAGCDVSSNQTAAFNTRHSRRSYTGTKITNRQESSSTGRSAAEFRADVTEMTEILLTVSLWGVQRTNIMSEKDTDVCSQPGIAVFCFFLSLGTRKEQILAESRSCSSSASHCSPFDCCLSVVS